MQTSGLSGYGCKMNAHVCGTLLFGFVVVAAAPASAAADQGDCRNGGFSSENTAFGLATVKGEGRVYLLYDTEGCPSALLQCKNRGYVLPGDRLVTGRTIGDYVCAYFPNRGGGSAGWVDQSRLHPLDVNRRPPPSSWLGRWSDEGNPSLRVTDRGGILRITGQAFWPGPDRERDWPSGWPHDGEIRGQLTLNANRAHYDDGDGQYGCKIEFTLIGDTLIASDNGWCGGANVRFDGVYSRMTR